MASSVPVASVSGPKIDTRLVSLDVFRGITMAAMVIVNNPGDWGNLYWPLAHAAWDGWTPTDLIFPFFLFIVGVSITLSRKSASWGSIARRAALIAAIGLFLAAYPRFDMDTLRIPGVLQRIAVCYLVAASFYKVVGLRGSDPAGHSDSQRFAAAAWMIGAAVALCVGYWVVMTQVPTPAGIRGDLTPNGNWGAYIDRAVFGSHLWSSSKTWDPEGLLSTVPAIATTLLGIACGLWIASSAAPSRKAALMAAAGCAAIAIGYLWNPFFPINKALWTSSYVFLTAGLAAVCLALCYWAIDIRGWRGWTKPFVILGTNAIALYAASGLLVETMGLIRLAAADGSSVSLSRWIYVNAFQPFAPPKVASLAYAIANLLVLFALLAWMYRRRLFLRV